MRGEALTAIGGHDRETVPLHVEWSPPKAKQKGLDWSKHDATPRSSNPSPSPRPSTWDTSESVESILAPAPESALQFEWAQLLADTADSTDRTIVSARFLALASLEHLRLVASVPATRFVTFQPKTPRPKRQPSTRGPGGSATRANTTEILRLYQAGETINAVSAATGHSKGTVRTHLLAAGVVLRDDRHTRSGGGNRRVDPPELTERVRALYEDEHLSQVRIAERLGIGHKVVQGIMRRGGIVAREGQSGSGDTLTGLKDRLAALGVKSADVRVWAKAHGHEVSVRGVVPADVLTAFEDAHR